MKQKGQHISGRFDHDIQQLLDQITQMIHCVNEQLDAALCFYQNPQEKTLLKIRTLDDQVNRLESKIDKLCLELIVKHSPIAGDLRIVLAVIKIVTNLERMGDQYLKFAEQVNQLTDTPFYKNAAIDQLLEKLIQTTSTMLKQVKIAFEKGDVKSALKVVKIDQKVDDYYTDLLAQLSCEFAEYASQPMAIKFTDFIIALRALERFGDHVVNIAHLVIYAVENQQVAHHSYPKLSKLLNEQDKP